MSGPLVSVLVPCFGQARFLGACVGSILGQTFEDWEAIIVASDDESRSAAHMLATDKRIRVIEHPPTGVADARNVAARNARGRYLGPLDADDEIAPTYLARTTDVIGSAVHAVAYTYVALNAPPGAWCPTWSRFHVRERNCLPYASLHTKALWSAAGGWDEAFIGFEDWVYWIACSRHDPVVTCVPEHLLRHRKWDGSRSRQLDQWAPVWTAMIHTRFPDLYRLDREDRLTIANMGKGLLDRMRSQLALFPNNSALQEWVKLVEGEVKP